jgi:hypothetical protein
MPDPDQRRDLLYAALLAAACAVLVWVLVFSH